MSSRGQQTCLAKDRFHFFDGIRESLALDAAYDPAARRKLRQLTLELVGLSAQEALG